MQIIPVIDIRNGSAVRAVAGERSQYRPLESRLTDSTEPAEVLKALQREFGFTHCYVADLDAIEGRARGEGPGSPLYLEAPPGITPQTGFADVLQPQRGESSVPEATASGTRACGVQAPEERKRAAASARLTRIADSVPVACATGTELPLLRSCSPVISSATGIPRSGFRGNRCTLAEMVRTGTKLILDAGVRSVDDARELLDLGIDQVVFSSESLPDVSTLTALLESPGSDSVTFSIDLKHGQLLTADSAWSGRGPIELIATVVGAGFRQIIILDLAAVGTGLGIPTLELCREVKRLWPGLSVISGGGVHSPECLLDAERAGIDGLLVASALHDGCILNVKA